MSESCIDVEEIDGNDDDDDEYGANSQDCCAQRLISREIPIQDNRPCGRPSIAECDDDDHDDGDDGVANDDVMAFAEGNKFGLSGQISQDINQINKFAQTVGGLVSPLVGMPSNLYSN